MEQINVELIHCRTNCLLRKIYTLNTDEESEVSQLRLPDSLQAGPHNLPNWLRVIAMEMELSRT